MTALEIINKLKSARGDAMLWIIYDRKEAALHPGYRHEYAVNVPFADAMMARTDPALDIIQKTQDGELFTA